MPRPPERTLTALLSSFTQGERVQTAVLLPAGRADRLGDTSLQPQLIGEALAIGRGAAGEGGPGELRLEDPLVSGRHARVVRAAGGYEVSDEGSKNGTYLEAERLAAPAPLCDGARLFIGNHLFVFRQLTALDTEALDEERQRPLGPVATSSPVLARVCHKLRRLAPAGGELF